MEYAPEKSVFSGFEIIDRQFESRSFTRGDYPNACEIVALREEKDIKVLWGSRCGKWAPATARKRWEEKGKMLRRNFRNRERRISNKKVISALQEPPYPLSTGEFLAKFG